MAEGCNTNVDSSACTASKIVPLRGLQHLLFSALSFPLCLKLPGIQYSAATSKVYSPEEDQKVILVLPILFASTVIIQAVIEGTLNIY